MTDNEIKELLLHHRVIVSVGLSSNPARPSNAVTSYLKEHGYRIIPVNPRETEVLGEKSYATLADVPETIEFVQVFRRPDAVPEVVKEAIRLGAKVIWLQDGAESAEAERLAAQSGVTLINGDCMMREHRRLLGR